jgi:DSF synthase
MFPSFREIALELDSAREILWVTYLHEESLCFSISLLKEQLAVLDTMDSVYKQNGVLPFKFVAVKSARPGIFHLGGDLEHFSQLALNKDQEGLTEYAHLAADLIFRTHSSHLPVVFVGLVEGDALGGGLEALLSFHTVFADRNANMGFPESRFGSFPGMGGYSFVSRRSSPSFAHEMISSGGIFKASDLQQRGLIDRVTEAGAVVSEFLSFAESHRAKFSSLQLKLRARARALNVSREELFDIVDMWVDCAMKLDPNDLRKMAVLALAQRRKLKRA